jgi:hypothetical protein
VIWNNTLNIDEQAYEVLVQAGEYDYSWNESALVRRDGQLYYIYSSGCSCYGFEETVSASDLVPVANWQEAVEKAKDDLAAEHAVTFAERAAELRPSPSRVALPRAVQIAQGGVFL